MVLMILILGPRDLLGGNGHRGTFSGNRDTGTEYRGNQQIILPLPWWVVTSDMTGHRLGFHTNSYIFQSIYCYLMGKILMKRRPKKDFRG